MPDRQSLAVNIRPIGEATEQRVAVQRPRVKQPEDIHLASRL